MAPKRNVLSNSLDRFAPPEGLVLLILSVLVGAVTGLAAALFIKLIFAIQHISFSASLSTFPFLGKWIYVIAPVVGGLLVGPLILFAKEAKGHGVPEVMQALILRGGVSVPGLPQRKLPPQRSVSVQAALPVERDQSCRLARHSAPPSANGSGYLMNA